MISCILNENLKKICILWMKNIHLSQEPCKCCLMAPHVFYIFILLNYVKFPAPTVGVNVLFKYINYVAAWTHLRASQERFSKWWEIGRTCPPGFFFQLCEVGGLRTSKGGLSEIWLAVRQQSQIFKESYLVLATWKNSLSKYGDSYPFFLSKYGDLGVSDLFHE
jgi:hypothetical protein